MKNESVDGKLPKKMQVEQATRKLKIAFVYSRLPFPMMRGDQLTVSHLLEFLKARGHSVDFYTLGDETALTDVQHQWLFSTCSKVRIFKHNLISKLKGIVVGLLLGKPFQIGYFYNFRQVSEVRKALTEGKYDVGYVYYIRSAETMRGLGMSTDANGGERPATFLALQLSQTLNIRRIYENSKSRWKKAFYAIEAWLMMRYEGRIWKEFTRTVLIGHKDVEEVKKVCEQIGEKKIDNYVFGAHGTDIDRFTLKSDIKEIENCIVFSGAMKYEPNIQAICWFCAEVWPLIKSSVPNALLMIVGRDPAPEVVKLGKLEDVTVTGEVPEPADYIAKASVCINPMLAAGGMQNKLLEYMASGKAVVATQVANEGINAPANQALIIANGCQAFAESTIKFLQDEKLRKKFSQNARRYVENNWTWEAHFLKLEKDMYSR
jgi:glycosyltransferase involved in cell wall biosynthesis